MEGRRGRNFKVFELSPVRFRFPDRVYAALPGSDILPPQSATSAMGQTG